MLVCFRLYLFRNIPNYKILVCFQAVPVPQYTQLQDAGVCFRLYLFPGVCFRLYLFHNIPNYKILVCVSGCTCSAIYPTTRSWCVFQAVPVPQYTQLQDPGVCFRLYLFCNIPNYKILVCVSGCTCSTIYPTTRSWCVFQAVHISKLQDPGVCFQAVPVPWCVFQAVTVPQYTQLQDAGVCFRLYLFPGVCFQAVPVPQYTQLQDAGVCFRLYLFGNVPNYKMLVCVSGCTCSAIYPTTRSWCVFQAVPVPQYTQLQDPGVWWGRQRGLGVVLPGQRGTGCHVSVPSHGYCPPWNWWVLVCFVLCGCGWVGVVYVSVSMSPPMAIVPLGTGGHLCVLFSVGVLLCVLCCVVCVIVCVFPHLKRCVCVCARTCVCVCECFLCSLT